MSNRPFNPLDKLVLARTVARVLVEQPVVALPPPNPFTGAGIYAIYYTGAFPQYRRIAALNKNNQFRAPIYVGRAVPKGARKGASLTESAGNVLYGRLREHADSVNQASNLNLNDFPCRYLVVEDIWIPLAERLLIGAFAPLWNRIVDGFGNHDPGTRRKDQWRSDWDILHPGRPWAEKLGKSKRSVAVIEEEVADFWENWKPEGL